MSENNHPKLCGIMNCGLQGTNSETAESEHWRFTVFYCDEHRRELEKGVPIGVVGVDPSLTVVEALGQSEPQTGAGARGAID